MDNTPSELDELICNKMAVVRKLKGEHKALLKSRIHTSDLETEDLNSKLYRLMAEVEYLKNSEPEIMPKCDAGHFAFARHSLEEEIKEKEKTLIDLDEMYEESTRKKKLLLERRSNTVSENEITKMLEDARTKNELLRCLHRKLVRRLRRLSRRFQTLSEETDQLNKSTRDRAGKVMKRSFYRVLKEFIVELQDRTFQTDNWEKREPVTVDETFCEEHLKILASANIIEKNPYNPNASFLLTEND